MITLPKHLIAKIISGDKRYEMRKCLPKNMIFGKDGFFAVEKGTNEVRCWCRVDRCIEVIMTAVAAVQYAGVLGVSPQFILDYAPVGTKVYLWEIGKVNKTQDLCRNHLFVGKNPQQFAYCQFSCGEPY